MVSTVVDYFTFASQLFLRLHLYNFLTVCFFLVIRTSLEQIQPMEHTDTMQEDEWMDCSDDALIFFIILSDLLEIETPSEFYNFCNLIIIMKIKVSIN